MLDTLPAVLDTTPDILPALRRLVETGDSLNDDARLLSQRDRDYYDGNQLTDTELAELKRRRQPAIVKNRIRRKIDAMVGIEQRGRVDPRAYPREPGDEDAAELATKALVFVEHRERIDMTRSAAFENLLVEGYGGAEVCAVERNGQLDVQVKRLRWEEIVFDPHSREKDFCDAQWTGIVKWMALDAAREYARQFAAPGEDPPAIDIERGPDTLGGTFEDRPSSAPFLWQDKRQRRVRMVQLYHRLEGVWHLSVFTGRQLLYSAPSPYHDADGNPCNAMVLMSAYVDRENRRYGIVRDMISSQDEVNKRSSKMLHQLNSRQTMALKGAVGSVQDLKRELAAPDGHVEVDLDAVEAAAAVGMQPFAILPNGDQVNGQVMLLGEAKAEIDTMGPNAALLGQSPGSASGRAIMAQQQAGLAELAPVYDALRDWTERLYRQVWACIRQTWDGPRWIRITADNEAPSFIGVNQPMMDPMGRPVIDQWGRPIVQNQVGALDVDIIVDQAPEYATLRAEQFETLANLARSGVPIPPQVIIEASDLRDKRKLLEAMKPPAPPQAPPPDPMAQQLALRGAVAEVAGKEAKAERDRAAAAKDMASLPKVQAEGAEAAADADVAALRAQAVRARAAAEQAEAMLAMVAAQRQGAMLARPAGF